MRLSKPLRDKFPNCILIGRTIGDTESLLIVDKLGRWSVEIWVEDNCYFAYNLFVVEEYRLAGLASKAMSIVHTIASNDCMDVYLEISNNKLIAMYDKLGYKKVSNSKNTYRKTFLHTQS